MGKKVLHLISSFGFFGAENIALELCRATETFGIKNVLGVFDNAHNSNLEILKKAGERGIISEVLACRGRFDFSLIMKLRKFIKSNGIDIVHSHGYKSNFYGFFSTFNTKTKNISTCHNWLGEGRKMKFYKWLDKLILSKFDIVIVVSESLRNELLKGVIDKKKLFLIRNGIEVDNFQASGTAPKLKELFGIQKDEFVIGTLGRLTEEKGHAYLLKAFEKVQSELPKTKLLIVGDGCLRKSLELEAERLNLKNKVIFTGFRNDVPELLSIMDIFVLPSLQEAMPIALLEAMAAQRPIIATQVGEIPTLIRNGYSGLLVKPKDHASLSNSIAMFLLDRDKAATFAMRSYEFVRNNFTIENMAKAYADTYKNLC